jgi:hypothetical protein
MSLPFGLWMLFQRLSWKNWLAFWLGTLIPLLVHALAVIPVTGDLKPGALHLEYFSWQSLKQQEILTSQLARENLQEYFIYLYHLLVGQRGFFLHCPVALLGLWACLKRVFQPSVSASERGFTCSCFMAMLLVIGYYSAFSKTFGDFCYSIRWFLAFLPLLLFSSSPCLSPKTSTAYGDFFWVSGHF